MASRWAPGVAERAMTALPGLGIPARQTGLRSYGDQSREDEDAVHPAGCGPSVPEAVPAPLSPVTSATLDKRPLVSRSLQR